jgi:hypothetical protein
MMPVFGFHGKHKIDGSDGTNQPIGTMYEPIGLNGKGRY